MWLLTQGRLLTYGWVLLGTLALNIILTLFAQRYARIASHTPAVLTLDIIATVAALIASGGWDSPFVLYAYSSLVLPALLFGWRGGIMAGLTFVAMDIAGLMASGSPPSDRIGEGSLASLGLLLTMVVPPSFGALLSLIVARLRETSAEQTQRRLDRRRSELDGPLLGGPRLDRPGYGGREREAERRHQPTGDLLTQQITRIRTAEPGVEELRRVIFAPFHSPDIELGAAFDVLAARFGQHTGINTRVALIGRARAVRGVYHTLLVRLAQEALLNIQQHAHAGSATLTLRYDGSSVALLIQDNGVGLLDGTYERPGLHALRAMHYRLAEIDGRLDVFETEGGGVTVRATLPLE